MRRLLTLCAVLAFAGTAEARPPAPDPSSFTIGQATVSDVESAYGRPVTDEHDSDGQEVLTYSHTRGHVKAATFVPIVGLFAGGAGATSKAVHFTFGADGKLKSYSTQDTQVDCGAVITGTRCSY